MKDRRVGDYLWDQWQGEGYEGKFDHDLVYFTQEHVDADHELVRRGLASALQRDGIADSLRDGFMLIETSESELGWAGIIEDELEFSVCDESGETSGGDFVAQAVPVTWVEFSFL